MKACVLESVGALHYREVGTPKPGSGEALLQIKACGICSSDIDRVFKTGTYHFPTIPGHEFSGRVVDLGSGIASSYLNCRAAVFPLLPCFECPSCAIGEYARCDNYNYFGSRCDGGFAEYISVPAWNLVPFSESLSYRAAAMCEPAAVALHTISAAKIAVGNTVAVIGCGTIGILAAMWAKLQGAEKVILVGRGEGKVEAARDMGFQYVISTLVQDPEKEILELTDEKGADVTVELAGNSLAISTAITCAKKGGTVVLTGNPSEDIMIKRGIYWKILRKELTVVGTWNSSYNANKNDWAVALKYMEKGLLPAEKLITHHFGLDECEDAFAVLRKPGNRAIKVMFEMNRR